MVIKFFILIPILFSLVNGQDLVIDSAPAQPSNDTNEMVILNADFNNLDLFKNRWIKFDRNVDKNVLDYRGDWSLVWANENNTDNLCLSTLGREKRYGMVAKLDQVLKPYELEHLVVQFDHKFNKKHCFNFFLKLSFEPTGNLRNLTSMNFDYDLVLQQEVCKQQIEFAQWFKIYDKEKHNPNMIVKARKEVESLQNYPDGNAWHTTKFIVFYNNTYELNFDGKTVQTGSFFRLPMMDLFKQKQMDYKFYERSLLERMYDISDIRINIIKKDEMIRDSGEIALDNIIVKGKTLEPEQDQMLKDQVVEIETFKTNLDENLSKMREEIEERQDDVNKVILREDFNKGENFVEKWIKLKQNIQKDIGDYTGDWYLIVDNLRSSNDYSISTKGSEGERVIRYGIVSKLGKVLRPANLDQLIIQYELKFHKYPCFKFQFNLFNDLSQDPKYVDPKSIKYPSINIRQAVCDQQVTMETRYRIQGNMYDGRFNTSDIFVKDHKRVSVNIGHYPSETLWHTTRLVINRDNTYALLFDGNTVKTGTFFNMSMDGFDHHFPDHRFYGSDIMSKLFDSNAIMVNVKKENEMNERELVVDNIIIKAKTNGKEMDFLDDKLVSDNSGPESVKSYIDRTIRELRDNVTNSLLPIGFIYTQLPNQSPPNHLWPNLRWTELTDQYNRLLTGGREGSAQPKDELTDDSSDQTIKLFKRVE